MHNGKTFDASYTPQRLLHPPCINFHHIPPPPSISLTTSHSPNTSSPHLRALPPNLPIPSPLPHHHVFFSHLSSSYAPLSPPSSPAAQPLICRNILLLQPLYHPIFSSPFANISMSHHRTPSSPFLLFFSPPAPVPPPSLRSSLPPALIATGRDKFDRTTLLRLPVVTRKLPQYFHPGMALYRPSLFCDSIPATQGKK